MPSVGNARTGILLVMDLNDSGVERLSRGECMRLMGSVPLGRIVYTRRALPAVELVYFILDDDGDIIIRTDASGKLATAASGAVVAFEADSVDLVTRTGWSVTVVGYSEEVIDSREIRRLKQSALAPWAPAERDYFLKVSPTIVNGRRIGFGGPSQPRQGQTARRPGDVCP